MSSRPAPAIALALVALSSTAQAEWVQRKGPTGAIPLVAISSPDAQNVFAVGASLQMGEPPVLTPHVYTSINGGQDLVETAGSVGDSRVWLPTDIFFVDAGTGWVSGNRQVYRTVDRGASWDSAELGFLVYAIHFFDAMGGIAAGQAGNIAVTADGGATWSPASSPTSVGLRDTFWLDSRRGWIAAHDSREESGTAVFEKGAVLRTTDGGATWELGGSIPNRALGPIFFLPDGQTGWVAGLHWVDQDRTEASLYKTMDGGDSFVDATPPLRVGTLQFIMSIPINVSQLTTMFWIDAKYGHLAGSAFVLKLTSGGGGSEIIVTRTVDYVTTDGGTSWAKTDLGTIVYNVGDPPPPSDGATLDGGMRSFYDGIMSGENQAVWGYAFTCPDDGPCPPDYTCDAGTCIPPDPPLACDPPCGSGTHCDNGTCVPDGGPTVNPGGFAGPESYQWGGCDCDASAAAGLWALLGVLGAWQRRARPARRPGVRL